MAETLNPRDITANFHKWLVEQSQRHASAVLLLYRSQPADPKRQVAEGILDDIDLVCGENDLSFVAVDTRAVANAFASLGVQAGTPKLVFVRGGKGAGTTLLNPRLDRVEGWIKDCRNL